MSENTNKIRCLIVDDEAPAHAILKNYIEQMSALTFVGSAFNAVEASNFLHKSPVDVLFLDINMPRMTGLEMLESLKNPPKTILTTAYSEFALKSYEFAIVDYLLKPISFPRFLKAINKIIVAPKEPFIGTESPVVPESFWVKTDKGLFKLNFQDILFLQSIGNYVRLTMKTGETHITGQTTKDLEEQLIPAITFVRIHKSYVINRSHLTKVDGGCVFLGKIELPIGAIFRKDFLKMIG
jgi:DNA-binding LytR/AlgR family response regulator